jgi:CheY-like chemotaxis protein
MKMERTMAKVLLVDGDSERRRMAVEALGAAQFEVAEAPSASVALTTLEWNRPDVVVSQEDVPELDGYELCSIIRSDPSTKALPFLLLTGPAGPPAGAPTRAGVDLVLGGTFDAADVTNRVQRLVSLGRSPCPRY